MSIESHLRHFIGTEIILDAATEPIADTDPLISSGRVDSMGLLQLLGFIQVHYGVDLTLSGEPQDYESITSLAAAVRRIKPGI